MAPPMVAAVSSLVLYKQVGHRLPGVLAAVQKLDVSAHALKHPQDSVAGGIDAHVSDEKLRVRDQESGGQEEGGGGDVSRNSDFLAGKLPGRLDDSGGALGSHIRAEARKHQLRVVSGDVGFRHPRLAVGVETGQQDGGFHLGGGHRGLVADSVQTASRCTARGAQPFLLTLSISAPIRESGSMIRFMGRFWMEASPVRVAVEVLGRQDAGHEAHGGAAVSAVQDVRGPS